MRGASIYSLYFLVLIIYCAFDPNYTDIPDNNSNNVTIIVQNSENADIFEAIIRAADLIDSIHFFQLAKSNKLCCKIEEGQGRSFTVNGYVSNTWKYTKTFIADIGKGDTTFVITLNEILGPVPDVPENCALELLSGNIVKITWDPANNAQGYTLYRKIDTLADIKILATTQNTEFLDSTVSAEHTYHYGLTAYNSIGISDTSAYVSITIPADVTIPQTPEELAVAGTTPTSITIAWKKSAGAALYNIYRITGDGAPNTLIASIDSSRYTDIGLTPVTLYSYAVSAKNSVGESQKSAKVSATTLLPAPAVPQNASAAALSDKSLRITWDSVPYASEYEIHKSMSETGVYALDGKAATGSYISAGLAPNTKCFYKVKASNTAGISDFSNVASATTLQEVVQKPDKPLNVTAKELSPYAIRIVWSKAARASSYTVYRGLSATGSFSVVAEPLDTMHTDSGLSENTTYYYKISAKNSGGESEISQTVSAKTMILILAPTGLAGNALSSSKIALSWNTVAGADSYRVFRSQSMSGAYQEIAVVNQHSFSDSGLTANTTYYYKVSAKGASGESPQTSAISVTTKVPVPVTPDSLKAAALSATEIKITFATVSNASGYKIYFTLTPQGTFSLLTSVGSGTYTHNSLSPGTLYYYKVSAYNDGGESPLSDTVCAKTLATGPNTPTNVKAAAQSVSVIKITFTAVTGATGYNIYHSLTATGQFTKLDSVKTVSYLHDSLASKTKHYYKVSAYNVAGESVLSDTTSATTLSKKVAQISSSCRECSRCVSSCDVRAIKYQGGTYVVDTNLCTGCGDCISSCPYGYIKLVDGFKRAISWVQGLFTGESK